MLRRGQSLIEILIAVAVGAIFILGIIAAISPALKGNKDVENLQMGAALANGLIQNLKVFGESDWHNLTALATGSQNLYYLNTGKSPFAAATGTEAILSGPVDSLAGFWKFDEGSGTSTIDLGSSGVNGILYNDVSWATSSKSRYSISFGGSTAQVVGSNSANLKYQGGDMTLSLWMKADFTDDGGVIISKPWNGSGQYNYRLTSSGGTTTTLALNLSGATSFVLTGGSVSADSWHHVAIVLYSSSSVNFYIDGALAASGASGISNWVPGLGDSGVKVVMGCIYPYESATCAGNTAQDYKGLLDDVRVYTRVLSPNEVKSLANGVEFSRSFYLDNVGRDGNGKILVSGGTDDPSTKKATVNYRWGTVPTSTISQYLTRSADRVYTQTDWSSGPGQTTATSSVNSKFASSSSNINYSSTTGSITIQF
jgi:hypothetical protein